MNKARGLEMIERLHAWQIRHAWHDGEPVRTYGVRYGSTLEPTDPRYLDLWHTTAFEDWTDAADAFAREYPPHRSCIDWEACKFFRGKRFRLYGRERVGRTYIVTGEPWDWSVNIDRSTETLRLMRELHELKRGTTR